MEEKILKCDVEQNAEALLKQGFEDEGDVLIKSINENSKLCIDKETGIVADITNDGVSCESLSEVVQLCQEGIITVQQGSEEEVENAKTTADGVNE